jgi:hypothetical protein
VIKNPLHTMPATTAATPLWIPSGRGALLKNSKNKG